MAARKRTAEPVETNPAEGVGLLEFCEATGEGRIHAPTHLAPAAEVIEDAEQRTGARFVIDAPVQHGKTTLIERAIAWILLRHPERPIIYLTYGQRKAERHSRNIRALYSNWGGRIQADFNTIHQWQTEAGGGLLAVGRDGEITGNPAAHVFFDDPYKNREEAESADIRQLLEDKLSAEIVTRVMPGGSIGIIASRWHQEDLSGTRAAAGWHRVHLRAIERDDDGSEVALCPWGPDPDAPRTLEFLRSIRDGGDVTDQDWHSLYQGEPRPRGAGIFGGVSYYDPTRMPAITRIVAGIDAAFSASSSGDRCAVVVPGLGADGDVYVLTCQSWRMGIIEAEPLIHGALGPYAGAPIVTYASGPEVSAYRTLARNTPPLRVAVLPARLSKYTRSQRTAARWNAGRIRVPQGAPWVAEFVRVVTGFTGADGARDDEVDALVAAHDVLVGAGASGAIPVGIGRRCM